MQSKRIAISTELHQKLINALAASLGIRRNLAEKSIDTFLSDVLDRLADDPSMLKRLLSSGQPFGLSSVVLTKEGASAENGSEKNAPARAQAARDEQ